VPEAPIDAPPAVDEAPSLPGNTTSHPEDFVSGASPYADIVSVAIVLFVFVLPLRGLLRAPGPPMEEGFMLAFPERVLHGDIPKRDFLHLYGPGSLWALASAFKVFGTSLITERTFGLFQQLAIALGMYAIVRRWTRTLAVMCAGISAVIIIPFGLSALAWVGAVGLALIGIAAGIAAYASTDPRNANRWAFAAGVLLATALLFRPDLIVGVVLATVALVWRTDGSRRVRLVGSLVVATTVPYLIHAAMAGPTNAVRGMILDPVFNLRGGRKLPLPPSWNQLDAFLQRAGALQQLRWPIPAPRASQQLFIWFFVLLGAIALLLFEAWHKHITEPRSVQSLTLIVMALFSLGILPQALQRADSAHLAWVSCVPLGFLPVALYEILHRRMRRVRTGLISFAAGAVVLALLGFVLPAFTVTRYADYSLQTFGIHRNSFPIINGDRVFYYGKEERAAAGQQVIDEVNRIAKPGQRLFVGPGNLRKTAYSDAYLYFMLPQLKPATYYIEMDPMDTKPHSRLASDLKSADIVILSKIWDDWSEPNDSAKLGSDEAEQELARDFCPVGTYLDLYQLYRKCPA
jgi:hypothetical protein